MADIVLAETTSLGVRYHEVERRVLARSSVLVSTRFGDVNVKMAHVNGRLRAAPEYEDCARLARGRGVPLQTIYDAALAAALEDADR